VPLGTTAQQNLLRVKFTISPSFSPGAKPPPRLAAPGLVSEIALGLPRSAFSFSARLFSRFYFCGRPIRSCSIWMMDLHPAYLDAFSGKYRPLIVRYRALASPPFFFHFKSLSKSVFYTSRSPEPNFLILAFIPASTSPSLLLLSEKAQVRNNLHTSWRPKRWSGVYFRSSDVEMYVLLFGSSTPWLKLVQSLNEVEFARFLSSGVELRL